MLSIFLRDGIDVYRTYSTTSRRVDRLVLRHDILDLCPTAGGKSGRILRPAGPNTRATDRHRPMATSSGTYS
jgi:Bacterial protein of unknown function (DUF899)